jgi:hypothetical protein
MEGMNQSSIQYTYTWKYHSETLYINTLNKQKYLFFSSKMEDRNVNQVLSGVLVPVGGGRYRERV